MKIHKLIELWKEMEESGDRRDGRMAAENQAEYDASGRRDVVEKLNPEEILNSIQFLDRCVRRAGYHYTLAEPAKESGRLLLSVKKEISGRNGEGGVSRVAEVKLWDNREHWIRSRFSLRRLTTDEDGCLDISLPCGEYEAEVGCGPEYAVQTVRLVIEPERQCKAEVTLPQVISMEALGWISGDLHHHSVYSSPVYGGTDPVIETPEEVCRSMKAMGMRFGALSDHHNTKNHEVWREQTRDFIPILSKEISTANGHVLSLGVDEDVIYQIRRGKDCTLEWQYAEFLRICEEIRKHGGLPQVNHPFDVSASTRFNSELLDKIEMFESMEIWNGATPFANETINGKAFEAWLGYLEEGKVLTATAGSDTHNIYGDDYFGMIEWIRWLMELVLLHPEVYPEQMAGKVRYLFGLYREIFPELVRWVELSNTPSNVHNYVRADRNADAETVLAAIRAGKVFVSNGPLLLPAINDAGIGDTAQLEGGRGKLTLLLVSEKRVENLYLYTGAKRRVQLPLDEKRTPEGFYDYSMTIDSYDFKAAGVPEASSSGRAAWAVFVADGGANCTAVCNPVFLEE